MNLFTPTTLAAARATAARSMDTGRFKLLAKTSVESAHGTNTAWAVSGNAFAGRLEAADIKLVPEDLVRDKKTVLTLVTLAGHGIGLKSRVRDLLNGDKDFEVVAILSNRSKITSSYLVTSL